MIQERELRSMPLEAAAEPSIPKATTADAGKHGQQTHKQYVETSFF
jgi:hypothetical protein